MSSSSSSSSRTRVYVGKISTRTREADIHDLFSKYGHVRHVDVKYGFAFVVCCAISISLRDSILTWRARVSRTTTTNATPRRLYIVCTTPTCTAAASSSSSRVALAVLVASEARRMGTRHSLRRSVVGPDADACVSSCVCLVRRNAATTVLVSRTCRAT